MTENVRRRAAGSAILILRSAHAQALPQSRTRVRASRRMRTATAWPELDGPIVTVPPPASEPISTKAALPIVRAAPVLTVKPGKNEELLLVPLLMVNVAPF